MFLLKSPFLGDGFTQKSSFGRWFHPKVDFWVMVSPKSPFLGDISVASVPRSGAAWAQEGGWVGIFVPPRTPIISR